MNTDRDRLLKENEERARSIKEELIALREAMLRSENELNVLAIERTNLETAPGEEQIEISQELRASVPMHETVRVSRKWPKLALGVLMVAAVLSVLGALGIFNNGGSAPVAHRVVRTTPPVASPSAMKDSEATTVTSSQFSQNLNANSASDKMNNIPHDVPMSIIPGTTYTSEISYSMKSSVIILVEVQDTPQVTLHLNHASQSFFIPLKTTFRVDDEGISSERFNGKLIVLSELAESKKHGLEIRFEPSGLSVERKNLGVSSSQ